jgi:hypothetical protein
MLTIEIAAGACALMLALSATAGARPPDDRPVDWHRAAAPPAPLATPPPPTDRAGTGADGWRIATIVESALLAAWVVVAAAAVQLLRTQRDARSIPYTGWSNWQPIRGEKNERRTLFCSPMAGAACARSWSRRR